MFARLEALRARIDRLAAEEAEAPGLADRAARLLGALGPAPEARQLLALDRDLERAGIHTLADARLLAQLARSRAKAGAVGRGLGKRARQAMDELDEILAHEERRKRLSGRPSLAALALVEDHFSRLVRAVKVADLVEQPREQVAEDWAPLPRARAQRPPPTDARVAAAEFLVGRAKGSALDALRKRRDLETAHEMLLRIGSEVDRERVRGLRSEVARERWEVSGARSHGPAADLGDARRAGDGSRAWEAALSLYRDAVEAGDAPLAAAARRVLGSLEDRIPGGAAAALARDRGSALMGAVGEDGAIAEALAGHYASRREGAQSRDLLSELALDLDSDKWAPFELAVGAGRFFDIEASDAVEEEDEPPWGEPMRLRRVPFPAPVMEMDVAQGLGELANFVISDPRMLLYDTASGRQLARAWYAPDGPRQQRKRRGAVRVYVCDASGSMTGHRARFRDAVLIAELNNLSVRLVRGQPAAPVYFSFFTDHPTELERVDSARAAMGVIRGLFAGSPAEGKTDITYALESAFAAIRDARGRDRDLARATVVLVTDGEDAVDLERVRAARAPFGEIEVSFSFISLGRENADLKRLVLEQREAGRRAFYYHLTDEELAGARSAFDSGLRTLLPTRPEVRLEPDDAELGAAVDALLALADERRREPPPASPPGTRFEAWFPAEPQRASGPPPGPGELDRICDLLGAVADALSLAPSERRTDEAVTLLEHLLRLYGVAAPCYLESLALLPSPGREALRKIRLLCPGRRVA